MSIYVYLMRIVRTKLSLLTYGLLTLLAAIANLFQHVSHATKSLAAPLIPFNVHVSSLREVIPAILFHKVGLSIELQPLMILSRLKGVTLGTPPMLQISFNISRITSSLGTCLNQLTCFAFTVSVLASTA